jgi:hypothetical protein
VTGERAGIQATDADNVVANQVFLQRIRSPPGRILRRRLSYDEARRLRPVGLTIVVVYPVVSDEGVRHHDMLPGVRRVRKDLLIARHGRIEYDFPEGGPPTAETKAVEAATILKKKVRQVTS